METYLAIGNDAAVVATNATTSEQNTISVSSDTTGVNGIDTEVTTGSINTSDITQIVQGDVQDMIHNNVADANTIRVITMLDDSYSLHVGPEIVNMLQNTTTARVESVVTLPSGIQFDNHYTLACNTFTTLENLSDSIVVFSASTIQQTFNNSVPTILANRLASLNEVENVTGTDSILGSAYSTVTQKTVKTLTPEPTLLDRVMGRELTMPTDEEIVWHLVGTVRDCLTGGNALTHRPQTGNEQIVLVKGPESHVSDDVIDRVTDEIMSVDSVYRVADDSLDTVSVMVVTNGVSNNGDIQDMFTQADRNPDDFGVIVDSMSDIYAYGDDTENNPLFKCAAEEEPGAA